MAATTAFEALVREVLDKEFGRTATNIVRDARSNNSSVYAVEVSAAEDGKEARNRQPGTAPLPTTSTKLIMRFTNPDAFLNNDILVQSEVASMDLARRALSNFSTPLVPQVYAWKGAGEEPGWILMETMPGGFISPDEFEKLETEAKRKIIAQIAQILKSIQDYELPSSINGYGGLDFGDSGEIVVGPTPIHGTKKGCETYHGMYKEYLHTQLDFMDRCDVIAGWKGTGLRPRIDNFVEKGFDVLLDRAALIEPRSTLIHGDFDLANLLFELDTHTITAVLDFNFSHVASVADEYFYSLQCIYGLVGPPDPDEMSNAIRQTLLRGVPQGAMERRKIEGLDWDLLRARDEEFSKAGVQQPKDLMPGIEVLSELYWFIQNLSPPQFFMPRFRAKATEERLQRIRNGAKESLESSLSQWGY